MLVSKLLRRIGESVNQLQINSVVGCELRCQPQPPAGTYYLRAWFEMALSSPRPTSTANYWSSGLFDFAENLSICTYA